MASSRTACQRRQEIGVRLTLGATRQRVLAMILGDGLRMSAAGVVIGLAAAFTLTRIMRQLLFDVAPTDVVTFVAAPAVLLVAAFVACVVPARRAATLDPVEAIRGGRLPELPGSGGTSPSFGLISTQIPQMNRGSADQRMPQ
jgi:ABC-type lipoprotein release transport system permease subunit